MTFQPSDASPFVNLNDVSSVSFVSSVFQSAGQGGIQMFNRNVAKDEVVILTGASCGGENGENPDMGIRVDVDGETLASGTERIGGFRGDAVIAGVTAHNSISAEVLETGSDSGTFSFTFMVITK